MRASTLGQRQDKSLTESRGALQITGSLASGFNGLAWLLSKLGWLAHPQPRGTRGRQAGGELRVWWKGSGDVEAHRSSLQGERGLVACGLRLVAPVRKKASEGGA